MKSQNIFYDIVVKNRFNKKEVLEEFGKNPDEVRRKIKSKNQELELLCIYPQKYAD